MMKCALQAAIGAIALMVATGAVAKGSVGGGGRASFSVSKPSYSPARPATASSWAVSKPVAPAQTSLRSSASKAAQAKAADSLAPAATKYVASQPTQVVVKESSGSFWTSFVLGYMMAPKQAHATETKTVVIHDGGTPTPINGGSVGAALQTGIVDGLAAASLIQEPMKGPFVIEVPEQEFFDADCKVQEHARDFIKHAKVEHSVLFMAIPEKARCAADRPAISSQIPEAIVVKSGNGKLQLSRHMGGGA